MALGGGTFTSQDKILAGTYVNVISGHINTDELSSRGVVGVLFAGTTTTDFPVDTVKKVLAEEFEKKAKDFFGVAATDESLQPIREILKNAHTVYVYKVDSTTHKDTQVATNHTAFLDAIQNYPVNVVVCGDTTAVETYVEFATKMRNDYGVKLQVVVPYTSGLTAPNNEGVICVYDNANLVYWVGGASAGCAINKSLTNTVYNGELELAISHTQEELITLLQTGYFVFHKVGDEVRVLEDINTLTESDDANVDVEVMKYNQTVRIVDQIATDSAVIFNNEFIGKVQNNEDGRISLWNRIVSHRKNLETLGAIENYNSADTKVLAGETNRSVVINDKITVVNAMSQLYLTVVVQ